MASSSERLRSFRNVLAEMRTAKDRDLADPFVLSGVISKFCLLFDLSWKVLKDLIRDEFGVVDYALGSPATNIRQACACGIISEEDAATMLEHMRLRNRFAHDYNSSLAEEAVPQIVGPYVAWYDHLEKLILSYYD